MDFGSRLLVKLFLAFKGCICDVIAKKVRLEKLRNVLTTATILAILILEIHFRFSAFGFYVNILAIFEKCP